MTTNGAGDDGNVCTQCADNLGWTLEYSPVQRAEPAAVALYAGRVEGHQAARLCPSGVRGHIPPAIRSESFCFCLWRTERTDWVAECVSSLQNAKFIVCEYFPAGNVIGQFPYVALISPLVVGSVLTCSGFAEQAERTVSAGLCGEGLVPPKRRRG